MLLMSQSLTFSKAVRFTQHSSGPVEVPPTGTQTGLFLQHISNTRSVFLIPHISQRLVAIVLACCSLPIVSAQIEGEASNRVVGTLVLPDLRNANFLEVLSHPLINIDSVRALGNCLPDGLAQPFRSQKQQSTFGVRWYFVPGTQGLFQKVRFQEVVDEAEVRQLLRRRQRSLGTSATLTSSEGLYHLANGGRSVYSAPPDVESGELAALATINRAADPPGYRVSTEVVDRNGELFVESSWQATEIYRYHQGVLFDAAFSQFPEMNLPSHESLMPTEGSSEAVFADFVVDRIPQQLRQTFFQTAEAILGTRMQQKSNEADEDAQLRRSVLKACQSIVRGALLNVEHVKGSVRLPADDGSPYQSLVVVEASKDSQLSSQLRELASGHSLFASVLKDNAALTAHTCIQLPQETRGIFAAVDAWLRMRSRDGSFGLSPDVAGVFCDILEQSAEHRTLEAVVKIGWAPETDGVIYGGIRVANHAGLLTAVSSLISTSRLWPDDTPSVSLTRIGDHTALSIALPQRLVLMLRRHLFLNIEYVYLTQEGSRFWFAAGSESAVQVISDCIDVCGDSNVSTQTPLLSMVFDVEQWRSYPNADSVGVGEFLEKLDRQPYEFPPVPNGVNFARRSIPVPDIESILILGGEQKAEITVWETNGDLNLSCHVGEAIVNYALVRVLDYHLRWMPVFGVE